MFSKSPVFNLKAVLQETGLIADTLRAWNAAMDYPRRTAAQAGTACIRNTTSKPLNG